jgi:two-component system NtrC family response regulator
MKTILIVDDDAALRESLAEALNDLGYATALAENGRMALDWLEGHHADAVLLDLRMPGLDGMEVLKRVRARPAPPPVAVLTAVPTASNTIEAMRLGAVDHLAKPIGRADLAALVARMLPAASARPSDAVADSDEDTLVGGSAAMRNVQKAIGMLADSDASVLITGETGTGKEVVARAIHRHGRRAQRPFVALNCAAIPAELLESQLFGHTRGAFTGAVADTLGSFRAADKGTLFLDEIGDMAPPLQAKLLRVLQDSVVTPVGGKPVAVDVRIISATHRDLSAAVKEGKFREDLFYRLGVVPVALPPLRERLADIVELAEHFLQLFGQKAHSLSPPRLAAPRLAAPRLAAPRLPAHRLSAEAAARLLAHAWPGNVRELRNAMERAAVLGRREIIAAEDLFFLSSPAGGAESAAPVDMPGAVARLEQAMIRQALADTSGNRTEAARRLGIHRQLLHEKLRRYGIEL